MIFLSKDRRVDAHSRVTLADSDVDAPVMHDRADQVQLAAEGHFPTLIFFRDLPNAREINAVTKPAIYEWRNQDPEGIQRSNTKDVGSWHSALDMATRPQFAVLAAIVQAHAERLFARLGYHPAYGPALSNMWANIHPRHGYNRSHVHPNALWSGAYYLQAPTGCGRLIFSDPRAQAVHARPFYRDDQPTPPSGWAEVYYEAIEGRLLFFPAWLRHEVEPNLSEQKGEAGDRISVSFNVMQTLRHGSTNGEHDA